MKPSCFIEAPPYEIVLDHKTFLHKFTDLYFRVNPHFHPTPFYSSTPPIKIKK